MAKKHKRNGLTAESTGGLWLRAAYTALTNGYLKGFVEGKIYRGSSKALCVPGLNCYSCPGALGACPIGSLQAVLDSGKFRFSCRDTAFYATENIWCWESLSFCCR